MSGTEEVHDDVWDSDTDMSNYKFYDKEKVDYYHENKWQSSEIEKTLDELIQVKTQSVYGEWEPKWIPPNSQIAPFEAMQKRYDIEEINRIEQEYRARFSQNRVTTNDNLNNVSSDEDITE